MPMPVATVEGMTLTNGLNEKTTTVVPASARGGAVRRMDAWKQRIAALIIMVAMMMGALGASVVAYAEGSDDAASDSSTATFSYNITDTQNLLGSKASEVSDKITAVEEETGAKVHLVYLESFNSDDDPSDWAAKVLEALNPDPNTVLLAVASNDGNLVVAVSSNSDDWLKKQSTVDKLSEAAQAPLMESTPDWAASATDMMDQIVKAKKTAANPLLSNIGIIIMGLVLLALIAFVVTILVRHVMAKKKAADEAKALEAAKAEGSEGSDDDADGSKESADDADKADGDKADDDDEMSYEDAVDIARILDASAFDDEDVEADLPSAVDESEGDEAAETAAETADETEPEVNESGADESADEAVESVSDESNEASADEVAETADEEPAEEPADESHDESAEERTDAADESNAVTSDEDSSELTDGIQETSSEADQA